MGLLPILTCPGGGLAVMLAVVLPMYTDYVKLWASFIKCVLRSLDEGTQSCVEKLCSSYMDDFKSLFWVLLVNLHIERRISL